MSLRANYQPVVIMALLKREPLSREQLAEKLHKANKVEGRELSHYRHVPVYDVLTKHGVIKEKAEGFYLVCEFSDMEKAEIIKVLKAKAAKWGIEN